MDIKLNTPEPVPQPEPTITLELSLLEANTIRAALGGTSGTTGSRIYKPLAAALGSAGFDRNEVGDLLVPTGPTAPYRY